MKRTYSFWVYIVTNWEKTTLYTGITNDITRRLTEHYNNRGRGKSFAGRNYCYNVVYYEWHKYVLNAIEREKEIKNLSRALKEDLITGFNPSWIFLNIEICGTWPPEIVNQSIDDWQGLVPPPDKK